VSDLAAPLLLARAVVTIFSRERLSQLLFNCYHKFFSWRHALHNVQDEFAFGIDANRVANDSRLFGLYLTGELKCSAEPQSRVAQSKPLAFSAP
jgi:hypothetical protein